MIIDFKNNYIFRVEKFGSIIINRFNKKIYELNKGNTLYLVLKYYFGEEKAILECNKYNYEKDYKVLEKFIINEKLFENRKLNEIKNIEDLKNEIFYIWDNINHLSFPLQIALYPSLKCNLRCSFCFMNKKLLKEDENSYNNISEILKLIDEADKNGIGSFSILGGEPLLYRDILIILKELEKRKISSSITTNGTVLRKEVIDFLKNSKYITPIISIQTLNEKNKQLMGIDYKMILKNIKKLSNEGIKFNINSVYTIQTNEEIIEMLEEFNKLNIKKFGMGVYVETNKEIKNKIRTFYEIRKMKEFITNYIGEKKLDIFFSVEGCMIYFGYPEYKNKNIKLTNLEKLEYGCEVGQTKLEIMSDGKISVCAAHTHFDNKINNVFEKGIKYIWENNRDLKYYRSLKNSSKKCNECNIDFFCNGGCPAERIKQQKTFKIERERDTRCLY